MTVIDARTREAALDWATHRVYDERTRRDRWPVLAA